MNQSNPSADHLVQLYYIGSIVVLIATVIVIYISAIRSVKIGKKIDIETNKLSAKNQLFLRLFTHRGQFLSSMYVDALNQIDVIFSDDQAVLDSWHSYHAIRNKNIPPDKLIDLHRSSQIDLLLQMALVLGYKNLKAEEITAHYIPNKHVELDMYDADFRTSALEFLKSGAELQKILIEQRGSLVQSKEINPVQTST